MEVVDRRPTVGEVLRLGHPLAVRLARHVHRTAPAPSVGERPGYADGAYRVEPVRVLDYAALERVRHLRVRSLERELRDDGVHLRAHVLRDPLGDHEALRVPAARAEELAVVGVVEERREAHHVRVAALGLAYPAGQVVHADGVPVVVPAAVALEQPADEVLCACEGPLVHDDRERAGGYRLFRGRPPGRPGRRRSSSRTWRPLPRRRPRGPGARSPGSRPRWRTPGPIQPSTHPLGSGAREARTACRTSRTRGRRSDSQRRATRPRPPLRPSGRRRRQGRTNPGRSP